MENYKLYTWSANMPDGPFFEVSFIANTVEAAREGILAQLREIKKAKAEQSDPDDFNLADFDNIQTEYIVDDPTVVFFGIANFTEDTKLESGERLGKYIMRVEPKALPIQPARIMVYFI
jgi:hypothetical protein